MSPLSERLGEVATAVETTLEALLPRPHGPEGRIAEAMRYAALGGGKRLRPFLVCEGARLFGLPLAAALPSAAAVEMLHCYSLVHDDLPAMDDDDLRRGRPTCHVAFDEATAILAGDALLTLAFETLSAPACHPEPAVRCALVHGLAVAGGCDGMVAGQMLDLLAAEAGGLLAEAATAEREALTAYGRALGLAFQIADDLLDVEGSAAETGKAVGKDASAGKATFVDLLGIDGARRRARELADEACAALARFGARGETLRETARFVVERRH